MWVSGALADEVLSRPEASGRSQLAEKPFGADFLFLVRDPQRAAEVRREQHAWLKANVHAGKVYEAIESVAPQLVKAFEGKAFEGKSSSIVPWPEEELGTILLSALLTLYTGSPSAQLGADGGFNSPTHPLFPICRTPFPPYARND